MPCDKGSGYARICSCCIYINPDLSVRERQTQRKLRSELAGRKENGESNIFIRRGRILKQRSPDQPQESTSEEMEDQSG